MPKIFLGGTCGDSKWRDNFIKLLTIDYFNPVVDDWTPECMAEERKQREECDYCLFAITPNMVGVFSIAEVVDDSNKRPNKTFFVVIPSDEDNNGELTSFNNAQLKSLNQVGKMVKDNGGQYFISLQEVADFVNNN